MRYLTFFSFLFLVACSKKSEVEQLIDDIQATEAKISADHSSSTEERKKLLSLYDRYFALPEADTQKVVNYLMIAGEMAPAIDENERALKYYDMVLDKYPDHPKALFMKAYTLDTRLGRLDEAKAIYELFLAKYPNDAFAESAAFSLKNLGKSPDEIVKGFDEKRKAKSEE